MECFSCRHFVPKAMGGQGIIILALRFHAFQECCESVDVSMRVEQAPKLLAIAIKGEGKLALVHSGHSFALF